MDAYKADAHKTINKFIEKKAKSDGYKGKGGLKGAIQYLEDHYKIPSDNLWSGQGISSTKSHHLDDLAHHPTLLGLVANVITTLFRVGIFVNKDGEWHFALAEKDFKELAKIWAPIIIAAVLNWIVTIAEKKYSEKQEREIPKPIRVLLRALATAPAAYTILKVTNNWIGHLISDMGGSRNTPDGGMGIPGIFLSFLKEISSIPGINMTGLPALIDNWYKKDHFNMRKEMAVFNIAKKQTVPVLLNELLVRSFYFVRNIVAEAKLHGTNWKEYNWEKTVPFSNRTVVRMLTIAHGTFVAVDLGDAAIRTAISRQYVDVYSFLARMALRVNFVGIGRFTIAVFSDLKMGYQLRNKVQERMDLNSKMLNFYGAKVFYKQAEVWKNAENAEIAMIDMEETAVKSINIFTDMLIVINSDIEDIKILADKAELHNLGIKKQLQKLLR